MADPPTSGSPEPPADGASPGPPAVIARRLLTPLALLLPVAAAAARDDDPPAWTWFPGGQLSVNGIAYDSRNAKHSGLETELAVPILDGLHRSGARVHVAADLDGEDTRSNLWEAWGEWPVASRSWLRAGLLRVPLGSEFATRDEDHALVGYGFPAHLAGRWDTGVRLDGYLTDDTWYGVTVTAGHGFDHKGRSRKSDQVAARLLTTSASDGSGAFEGPFAGVTVAWSPDYDDPIQIASPLEQQVFTTPDLDGGSAMWQHVEFGWRSRAFRGGVEVTNGSVSDVPVGGGREEDVDQLTSWAAYVVWSLRGEAARWSRGGWVPARGPLGSRPGAARSAAGPAPPDEPALPIEFALRYSNADIDRVLFDEGITTYDPSTQEVRTFSAILGGLVDPDTRLALQWTKIIADHELTTLGGDNRDSSWVLRVDRRFGRPPPRR